MRELTILLLVTVAGASTGRAQPADDAPERGSPNLLLIVADDMGYSDLGCYGGEIRTPNLDNLAAGGVRLTQFYNCGRCCPSRASILTGQYPHLVGLGHMTQDLEQPGYQGRLSDEAVTGAQILQSAGYRTHLAGKWHLGTPDPTRHGFDAFYGTPASARSFWDPDIFLSLPADRPRASPRSEDFYATRAVTDSALAFLRTVGMEQESPWFLYVAYHAPHFPLHAPAEAIERYAERYLSGWDALRQERFARMQEIGLLSSDERLSPRGEFYEWGEREAQPIPAWEELPADRRGDLARRMAIYAAMIDVMDQNIGRLLEALRSQGALANTLILFTSDNGACAEWDPFGFDIRSSRNNILHWDEQLEGMGGVGTFHSVGAGWANASNTPWRLFKHFNHEGGIASPAILSWPAGLRSEAAYCRTPAHVIDIVPTLLAAAGVEYPSQFKQRETQPLPGSSLLEIVHNDQLADRQLFFEHQANRAVREGNWKLVAVRGGPWQLHDMRADRIEQIDLAEEHPDVARRLAGSWDRWAAANQVLPFPDDYHVDYLPDLDD